MSIDAFHKTNRTKNTITCEISGKLVDIDVFFSMNCLKKLLDYYKHNNSYKESFARVSFYMYTQSDKPDCVKSITVGDFLVAKDDELQKIISLILSHEESLSIEYHNIDNGDVYQRFYIASTNLFKKITKPIAASLSQFNKKIFPHIELLQTIAQHIAFIESVQFPYLNSVNNLSFHLEQATLVAEQFKPFRTNYYEMFERFNSSALRTVLDNIPKISFDISDIIPPAMQQVIEMHENITRSLQYAIDASTELTSFIDFSLLTYHEEWSEQHDLLIKFGWFYLNELPNEIIDKIFEERDTITSDEVDLIIVNYFRENKCANLKQVVKKWSSSSSFKSRKHIFHEALVNHSRKYFNASTTMLVLHTEGVITDFFRIRLQAPKYRVKTAVGELSDYIDDMPMSILDRSDYRVYTIVLQRILESYVENFDQSNPDKASNNSRHKIAHGHAVEIETEVSSLKKFLYLNEVYRLFSMLDEQLIAK